MAYETEEQDGKPCLSKGKPCGECEAFSQCLAKRDYGELTVNQTQPVYKMDRDELDTVDDWFSWDEGFRAELHDGRLVAMTEPIIKHQGMLTELLVQLHNFLKGKPCKVFPAPIGVRLTKKEETIFEPDIVVICDDSKLEGGKICNGAPDMVIEILSPSTLRIDKVYKFNKYLEAGVREYWIADPESETIHVNILQNGVYETHMYDKTGTVPVTTVPVTILKGCEISLPDVFDE